MLDRISNPRLLLGVSDDEFKAVTMYHLMMFQALWQSGAILLDEEDLDRQEMLQHAVHTFALRAVIESQKRMGWLHRKALKSGAKKVEKALVEAGLLMEVMKLVMELLRADDELVGAWETKVTSAGRLILSCSPHLNPDHLTQIPLERVYG